MHVIEEKKQKKINPTTYKHTFSLQNSFKTVLFLYEQCIKKKKKKKNSTAWIKLFPYIYIFLPLSLSLSLSTKYYGESKVLQYFSNVAALQRSWR